MDKKKNEKYDLERYRSLFLKFGFIAALAIMLLSFEWTSPISSFESSFTPETSFQDVEEIVVTRQELPKPPETKMVNTDVLNLVTNDTEIEEEMETPDLSSNEQTAIIQMYIPEEKTDPYTFVDVPDVMPEFPGGEPALLAWIGKHVKYPQLPRESGIEGKVYIRFAVTKSGKVDKVTVVRGVHEMLDNEAVRVISMLPKWAPALVKGKPVNVWYTVPIHFKLD